MLKKITRRTFVSSLSVLAATPLLSSRLARAAGGKTVSVNQYNNNDWIAAFKQAFKEGDIVVVPAGLTCENINTGIFIPDGKTLLIRGALTGNGRGRFVLQEGCKVIGEGAGRTENITLDVRGSDCVIKGLAIDRLLRKAADEVKREAAPLDVRGAGCVISGNVGGRYCY